MLPDGLLSFPLTPFTAADRLDLAAYREHLGQQLAGGPGALFVACGTGEFGALSPAEYREVVRTAVETVAGRVPVYAGAGGGPALAREFAVAAAESGADGLLLLPPYLVTGPPAGYLRFVEHVAAGTDLPLIVYQRANARLTAGTAVALLDVPTVVGIKDGIGDVDAFLRIVSAVRASGHPRAGAFGFLNGLPTAELSAQAYRAIGVPSYSSAVYCFAPRIALAFHAAVRADDNVTTERLIAEFYAPFAELRDEVPGYAVALVKAGARLGGLDLGGVRPPLLDPTGPHVARLAEIIDNGHKAVA
ncbi:5-dehydro-4-deoxyglucarate dehydratase [Longispora sp. K20-0274]|uniref:5-dehydro-4-deoxyglucarate dehydratase n=1 Tax=Longispora sp. K20-0274 TaxID=3088255 RepID=UPI00399AF435